MKPDCSGMFWSKSVRRAGVVGLLGVMAAAGNAQTASTATPRRMVVPAPGGVVDLQLERPKDRSSAASRTEAGARVAGASASFTLGNRIIVDADVQHVRRLVGRRGVVRPAGPRGFVVVETPSVERAVELANDLLMAPGIGSVEVDLSQPKVDRVPTDPAFLGQWALNNFSNPAADVNAVPAWNLGYTGLGVVVGVIEFGWQVDHPDLVANFIAEASTPASVVTTHATSVAGIIAADNDNGLGGVGIAYDAGLGRLMYGLSTDNANAFLHRNDINDIKNNSWGPTDNARISYMSAVERAAIEQSVAEGRGGRGEVFVWASGNGGLDDRVDYDPYSSNRYTIAVGAVGDLNVRADYNEPGSSVFIVSHSSGNVRSVFSTTINGYTTTFGGTSASAPLASGVIALMLQANPELTWRDVQHVLANTAWQVDPSEESWTINGDGRNISEHYGFGALDAEAAVVAAQSWTNVGPEVHADSGTASVEQVIPDDDAAGINVPLVLDGTVRVESVELILNVDTTTVGDLRITLTSPSGTVSTFATPRFDSTDNLIDYIFTSTRCWGESSAGTWNVHIADERSGAVALWRDVRVVAHGTALANDCRADLDGNGTLDVDDVHAFLDAYQASDPIADYLADGLFTFFDLQAFLNDFADGCE